MAAEFVGFMKIAVIGGGSWGTALARLLAGTVDEVSLWFHEPAVEEIARRSRENETYLPGFPLPANLRTTTHLAEALAGAAAIVAACPSHVMREVFIPARDLITGEPLIVSASKGIEAGSLKMMTEVLADALGEQHRARIGALSGPSFAREVAAGMPTAVTVAAPESAAAERIQALFAVPKFRVYSSTDVIGVELSGAAKNVIAIAAGVSDGMGFGNSTRAAVITRGIAETARLVARAGGDPQTSSGLSGAGDLILTCTGDLSRNRTLGLRLGRGERLTDILADMKMVAEGVRNSQTVIALADKLGVELPICAQVRAFLHEGTSATDAVGALMARSRKPEFWGV
jgi:glycerol-3-phosphate dehydrogenase (NAD(P)+)